MRIPCDFFVHFLSGKVSDPFPDHFFDLLPVFDDLGVGDAPNSGQLCISGPTGSAAGELQYGLVNCFQSGGQVLQISNIFLLWHRFHGGRKRRPRDQIRIVRTFMPSRFW